MLKEFIEHIQKTTQPLITTVNGSTFCVTSDGNTEELLPTIFHPYTLDLNSLDALVTMVRTEASEMDAPLYIAVPDCKTVRCFGQSKDYDERCFRQVYLHVVRPETGRWEYAGGILGVRSSMAWIVWDAQHFGVPQRRRRVFLVADFAGYSAIPILAIPDSVPGYPAPRSLPRQIAATLIGSSFAYAGRA